MNLLDKIYNYCFRILSLKAYTEFELQQKIKGRFKDIKAETVDEILEKLKEFNYLNDAQFAEDYINYRTTISPRGKFLLKQELYKKGIAEKHIQSALNKINLDEVSLAKQLLEHKTKALKSFEPKKRKEKMMRFLLSRGFNYDVIKQVI